MTTPKGRCAPGPHHLGVILVLVLAVAAPASAAPDDSRAARTAQELWKEAAGLHIDGEYEAAVELYRRALDIHPTARIHNYLAWSLSELERYEAAAQHSREAIALDPDYPNAYNDLGAYLIEQGKPGEAEPWLREATRMDGYCCTHFAYYQLGRALLMQGRVEAARASLNTSLMIHPRYEPAARLLHDLNRRGLRGM